MEQRVQRAGLDRGECPLAVEEALLHGVHREAHGGLRRALGLDSQAIVDEVKRSNLRGLGGAGFPTGMKWSFIPKEKKGPHYLAVNADESEPGTFKDRYLIDYDPHQLLEGIAIASIATQCDIAYIFIRGEYHRQAKVLEFAIKEAYDHGIFGPNGVLGSAGPCLARDADTLPFLGAMRFDTADVARFVNIGLFDEIVMHEIGHVIGLGSLWPYLGLIADPSLPPGNGPDPHFIGGEAIAAFDRSGGAGYSAGAKVPVENNGGQGTADVHWRESVLSNELMTGFLNNGANPLSVITAAQFTDLRYPGVNYAASEPYTVVNPLALRVAPGATYHLVDDVYLGPVTLVSARGRIVGTVRIP